MNKLQSAQKFFPALTGVRAFAAYLVFIAHFSYIIGEHLPAWLERYFLEFSIGLPIFFVLTGFSLTFRHYDKSSLSASWYKRYMTNRLARIYPMYLLFTLCAFIYYFFYSEPAIIAGTKHPLTILFLNLTFLRGFFDDLKFSGVGQGWSLTVHMCFYLAAPVIFYIGKKYKILLLQPVVLLTTGFLLVLIFRNFHFYGFFGSFTYMMIYTFFGRCFEFFAGIALAMYVKKNGFTRKNNVRFTYIGFIMIFTCVAAVSRLPILQGQTVGLQNPVGIVINNFILPVSIALFLYGLITESTMINKTLSNKFVMLLGQSSYVFYLIHLGFVYKFLHASFDWLNDAVFNLYDKFNLTWYSPFEFDQLNLVYIFIIFNLLTVFLYKNMEEPLNHYIRKKASERRNVSQIKNRHLSELSHSMIGRGNEI